MALHQRLDAVAAEHGDRAFVLSDARTHTYADVVEASVRLADGLAALGVRAGDHVGLLMANHPEFIPLKFAISRAGAVAVPLNYLYRREELGYVLAQSECRALVTMTRFGDLDHLGMLDEIAPGGSAAPPAACPSCAAPCCSPPTGGRVTGCSRSHSSRTSGLAAEVAPRPFRCVLTGSATSSTPRERRGLRRA
jgi:fatty-acyl-CoA synthase